MTEAPAKIETNNLPLAARLMQTQNPTGFKRSDGGDGGEEERARWRSALITVINFKA